MDIKNMVKITPKTKIKWSDFFRTVDFSVPFTLRTLLEVIVNRCEIPLENLCLMFNCPYILDYYIESKKPLTKEQNKFLSQIEYLELSWVGYSAYSSDSSNERYYENGWRFDGVGCAGKGGKNLPIKITNNFRQRYALDFSPINELSNYKIKLFNQIVIEDGEKNKDSFTNIPYTMQINLGEMLYSIFWELSWHGSPNERNARGQELANRVKEIKQAIKDGTIDELCTPVKNLDEFFKEQNDSKKQDKPKIDTAKNFKEFYKKTVDKKQKKVKNDI
jgi:hypothetical protein